MASRSRCGTTGKCTRKGRPGSSAASASCPTPSNASKTLDVGASLCTSSAGWSQSVHPLLSFPDQRLDLCKAGPDDPDTVRGQIVISLLSRDSGPGSGSRNVVVDRLGTPRAAQHPPGTQSPLHWEERQTPLGRLYYINHHARSSHRDKQRCSPQGAWMCPVAHLPESFDREVTGLR